MSVVIRLTLCTFGCHTFPDTHLNKTFVRVVSGAFRDKVDDLLEKDGATGTDPDSSKKKKEGQ